MKNRIILFLLVAFVISVFVGCSQRVGDFTLISTKNVEIGGKYKKIEGRFEGDDSKPSILGIPLGQPNLKTAVDNCIESGNGDLLTNAVLDFSFWSVIIYGQSKYTVSGDVWVKASMSDLLNGNQNLYVLRPGPKGYQLVSLSDPSKVVKVEYLVSP